MLVGFRRMLAALVGSRKSVVSLQQKTGSKNVNDTFDQAYVNGVLKSAQFVTNLPRRQYTIVQFKRD